MADVMRMRLFKITDDRLHDEACRFRMPRHTSMHANARRKPPKQELYIEQKKLFRLLILFTGFFISLSPMLERAERHQAAIARRHTKREGNDHNTH